jgi:hypothetical protein
VRVSATRRDTPNDDLNEAEFFVWDYSATIYFPVGKISTLALHYFQSDAEVTRKGVTDRTAIEQEFGVTCNGEPVCESLIDLFVDQRTNGTSTDLGGDERLRSYPGGRFSGAHTVFYALEFRWNLSEEVAPFDYFIWKDVRTGLQLAFFAETGSVGETRDEVGDSFKSTFGMGFRLVSASGFVYRADIAGGNEGTELSVIFNYPF